MQEIFGGAQWIGPGETTGNAYFALVKTVSLLPGAEMSGTRDGGGVNSPIHIRITASSYYELFLNGDFIGRGPVYGDPQWCLYDEWTYTPTTEQLQVVIVVHHATARGILALRPAVKGGALASFVGENITFGTDDSWKCVPLPMWASDTPKRSWAMGADEDFDATREPDGWSERFFPASVLDASRNASLVPSPETIWANYEPRTTPYLRYDFVAPVRFQTFQASGAGSETIGEVAEYEEEEPLVAVTDNAKPVAWRDFDLDTLNATLQNANVFLLDLGWECIGHFDFEIDAPEGRYIEISGAELLRDGRPWIVRKGSRDTIRYRTRSGKQAFHSFGWSGFRYLHVVVRGGTDGITMGRIGCRQRRVPLPSAKRFESDDERLKAIFDLCQRTLEVGTQEHLIDCPTREQAQYWGDAVFIAQSLWRGFGEESYLKWYLDCFLHAPFNEFGQISSVYPGKHMTFPDYSLIPLLGQRLIRENTGDFYRVHETCDKALRLKKWYDGRRDAAGLVQTGVMEEISGEVVLVNFIDHPGLGWHDFPHRGIDREGISCPLNLFRYGFLTILAEMLTVAGMPEATDVAREAESLGAIIRERFFDGVMFHDAWKNGCLSDGTSWQANSLAVYLGLVRGEEAKSVMQTMLDRYDSVCRCSPYFHFYFLSALRSVGLHDEAIALIKKEWQSMLDGDATTTWEGFAGDEKDSLCHPWSTAPFLYLVTNAAK
jgi:hypothetical protein